MKKITTLFSALVLTAFGWQANAQSVTATYSAGDINTNDGSYSAACNGPTTPLVVTLPAGTWQVDSVSTAYDITAQSGAWMSEQRSQLGCSETATNEGVYASGTGTTGGTINYARTGLTFANGIHTGNVTFEMQAYRTWAGTAGCNNVQFIPDGTWTVEVFYSVPPTCPQPINLSDSNLTDTSAVLYWSEVGSATAWEVELGTTGFTATGAPTHTAIPDSNVSVTGLMPNTTYDYYVRAVCGAGDSSLWSGPHSFTTECPASFPAPYAESFDANTTPGCWTQSANAGGPWEFGPQGSADYAAANFAETTGNGGNYMWMDYSGTDDSVIIEMPVVDLSSSNAFELSFMLASYNTSTNDSNFLHVEAWNGSAWNLIASIQQDSSEWIKHSFPLTGFTYGTDLTKIRFIADADTNPNADGNDFNNDLLIDDVRISEPCLDPTAGVVTALTSSSAQLGWTSTGNAAVNWSIEYGPTGFTQGTGSVINGTTLNPFPLVGLVDGTTYDYYIISNCALGDKSAWAGPFNFTTYITGVGENTELNEVSIYPNPNNGVFTLNVNANNAKVNVMNTQGQIVLSKNVISNKETINLRDNAKGIYFVTVTSENGVSTHKITVQ